MERESVIIAIDFDGTIVEDSYPEVGKISPDAKQFIQKLVDDGYCIIINTCRAGHYARDAQDALDAAGIPYMHFNENCLYRIQKYCGDCRKMSANVYIDDKCILQLDEPFDWEGMYEKIIRTFGRGHVKSCTCSA